jgi:ribonuclease PH
MARPHKPGGNAGKGRPKSAPNRVTRELKTLAQQYTERAVEVLAAIMGDDGAPRAARVTAAIALLDRGHGKPMQQVEATGQDGAPLIPVAPGKIALAILNVLRAADTNGE